MRERTRNASGAGTNREDPSANRTRGPPGTTEPRPRSAAFSASATTRSAETCDRLGRMNTELVESALAAHGRRLVVLDDGEVDDDLVGDMVEVPHVVVRSTVWAPRCA